MNETLINEIDFLKSYLKDLENLAPNNKEHFITNREKNLAISMLLFSSLNSTIEIGESLISEYNLRTPLKYREIYSILAESKIISAELSEKFESFIYYRNLMAHQYGDIDKNKIYDLFLQRNFFQDFLDQVLNYIK